MRFTLSLLWFLALTSSLSPADPTWWEARGVKTSEPAANRSPANIGQAKHMAAMALAELQGKLPASAFQALQTDLAAIVNLTFPDPLPSDFYEQQRAILLTGQLKAIAKPFYDHLRTHDAAWLDNAMTTGNLVVMEPGSNPPTPSPYPWTEDAADDSNRAPATLGQLKAVFSLPFETLPNNPTDTDGDGLSDDWEREHFLNLRFDAEADPDNDGVTNQQELALGSDPNAVGADADSNGLPDDWEQTYTGSLAVYPPLIRTSLLAGHNATRPLRVRNDTEEAVNLLVSLAGNISPYYKHADSLTGGVSYAWEDISTSGTLLSTISSSDDASEPISLPFSFTFYGSQVSQLHVSSNGFLSTEPSISYIPKRIPSSNAPPNLIAPLWRDLDPSTSGDIYYQAFTDRFVVQFQNVANNYNPAQTYTFQVVIFISGEIQFRYASVNGLVQDATIGIQNASKNQAASVTPSAAYPAAGLAVRFNNEIFFDMNPMSAVLPPHSTSILNGNFNSLSFTAGEYRSAITLTPTNEAIAPLQAYAVLKVLADTDSDGMPDEWEILHGFEPSEDDATGDPDRDGYTNLQEFQNGTDPHIPDNSIDSEPDGMRDRWETLHGLDPVIDDSGNDLDSDGILNLNEFQIGSHPNLADSDADDMPDGWEVAHLLNPLLNDAEQDPDGDGLTNIEEFNLATDPHVPNDPADSDNDGMLDSWEIHHGLDPTTDDSTLNPDKDDLTNILEFQLRTNPRESDTDGDELPDGWEHAHQLDPKVGSGSNGANGDPDHDGLVNRDEYLHDTDPNDEDSDNDGTSDKEEIDQGSNPNDPGDGGKPPTAPLEEVEFKIGGDYASWRMEIQGMGPRDSRKLLAISPKHGEWKFQKHKLWRNNKYEITLYHTGSKPDVPDKWYCWEARVDGKPGGDYTTFEELPDYQVGPRTSSHKYVVVNKYWIADNRDGLLTPHLHSKGIDKAGGLKATLMPVEFKLRKATDVDQGWDDTRPVDDPDKWASIGSSNDIVRLSILGADADIKDHCEIFPSLDDGGHDIRAGSNAVNGSITDFRITAFASEKEGEIIVREKANHTNSTTPLKAFACATREVKVGIYRIVDDDIPSTDETPDEEGELWFDTSDTDIINLLNSVYQKQAGITFVRDPSSQKVDVKGSGAYNAQGEVAFDINQPLQNNAKLNAITVKVKAKVEAGNLVLPKLRIYLVKRLAESTDEDIVGVNYERDCFANRFGEPITVPHEVGHAFGLSKEGKGKGGTHDEGPWPEELNGESGLMAESGTAKWLRREDWKEATKNAANYE